MIHAYKNRDDELVCLVCASHGSHDMGDLTPVKNKREARGVCAICGAPIGHVWALAFSDTWERMYFPTKKDTLSEGVITIEYLETEQFEEKIKEFKRYGMVDLNGILMYVEPVDATA